MNLGIMPLTLAPKSTPDFRRECALTHSIAFGKNAQPAPERCRSERVWDFPTSIGVLGNGLQNIAVSVVIATWAWFVRVVRSYSVQEMGKDYILAARISGCNTGKLVFRHLIPNILPQFLVYVSTGVASSIIMVSSFAFLGLGLPSGTPEWGAMLNDARTALYSHPELLIYPGLCIFVTAAGFNLFGEALRDILTPEEDSL